ncbi:unnamed protein product [Ixodes pacificus]
MSHRHSRAKGLVGADVAGGLREQALGAEQLSHEALEVRDLVAHARRLRLEVVVDPTQLLELFLHHVALLLLLSTVPRGGVLVLQALALPTASRVRSLPLPPLLRFLRAAPLGAKPACLRTLLFGLRLFGDKIAVRRIILALHLDGGRGHRDDLLDDFRKRLRDAGRLCFVGVSRRSRTGVLRTLERRRVGRRRGVVLRGCMSGCIFRREVVGRVRVSWETVERFGVRRTDRGLDGGRRTQVEEDVDVGNDGHRRAGGVWWGQVFGRGKVGRLGGLPRVLRLGRSAGDARQVAVGEGRVAGFRHRCRRQVIREVQVRPRGQVHLLVQPRPTFIVERWQLDFGAQLGAAELQHRVQVPLDFHGVCGSRRLLVWIWSVSGMWKPTTLGTGSRQPWFVLPK